MVHRNEIILSKDQFEKISNLIANSSTPTAEELEEELGRATILDDQEVPLDVVMMNCEVQFVEIETQKINRVIVVYPQDANIDENKVSILAPIGAALIGLRVGQQIQWKLPGGKLSTYQVLEVKRL